MNREYTVKTCGKAHAWCNGCQPRDRRHPSGCACLTHANSGRGIHWPHTEEAKKKIRAARAGQVMSPCTVDARTKMGIARRRWHQTRSPEAEAQRRQKLALACAKNHAAGVYFKGPTSLELALRQLLTSAGFDFKEQEPFGRYVVDAWVPSRRLVFEADGMFWYHHQDREREARRDAYLVAHGAAAVVHLTDEDLREVTGQWPQVFRLR